MKKRKFVIPERFKKAGAGLNFFAIFELIIKGFEFLLSKLCEDKIIAFLLMFLFSFVLRYLIIIIYDHIEEDWFLVEYFKQKMQEKEKIKKLRWLIFLNPIMTVLYYRDGHHKWDGVPLKTFKLFVISEIACTIAIASLIYIPPMLIKMLFY